MNFLFLAFIFTLQLSENPGSGGLCHLDSECQMGEDCSPVLGEGNPVSICTPASASVKEGKVCWKKGQSTSSACVPGFYCSNSGELGICKARIQINKSCKSHESCQEGSFCEEQKTGSGICIIKKLDSKPCQDFNECKNGICAAKDGGEKLCSTPLPGGSPCRLFAECATGICSKGVCQSPLQDGSSCHSNRECQNGFCDPDSFRCGEDSSD